MTYSLERTLTRLDRRVGALGLLAAGAGILAAQWMMGRWLSAHAEAAAVERVALGVAREDLELDLAERQALRDLVVRDFARAKVSAATLSKSRKALYEGGLAVSEEKRLLEKQFEIMTFWVKIDDQADKLHLMNGDQTAESLALAGARPRAVGGEERPLPKSAAIHSKERFASPERPKAEQVGGQLQWEPPQVGSSVRASALGEYVLFTRESLVIHGPALKRAEHEEYRHLCLELPLAAARRLYARMFVGARVVLETP